MIIDLEKTPDALPAKTDVCIIGSGPAGLSLALRLLDNQPTLNLVVLEGGGRQPSAFSQQLYEGDSVGAPQHPPEASRVRALGGTSTIWSGWCNPLSPDDFARKPWIKDSGWPISYETLEPYYQSAFRFLGASPKGGVADNNYARYPLLKKLDPSRVRAHLMHHSFPAMNVGVVYEARIAASQRLHLYLNANLTGIRLSPDGSRVQTLQITHNNKQRKDSLKAQRYVLACGGIENPRLLLSSTDVQPNGVGNTNDCVGRYFIDHLHSWNARVLEFKGQKKSNYVKLSPYDNSRVTLGISPTQQQRKAFELANAVAYFSYHSESSSGTEFQQLEAAKSFRQQLARRQFGTRMAQNAFHALKDLDSLILALIRDKPGSTTQSTRKDLTLTTYAEQTPNRHSRILLSKERDALGMPRPVLDWQLTEQDYRSLRQSTLLVASELAKTGVGRLQLHHWLTHEHSNWPGYLVSSRHPMGTTRMSSNKQTGVVDEHCRVHDIQNLYISGSSVFPTGGYANPTLTIVALAQRLADHLSAKT